MTGTAERPLADAAIRHDITHAHDRTLFVEAGAGTGKTKSLVDRVVALVAAGTPIESLAVITFTEAAAAELRDRVRAALDRTDASPLEREALAGLDGAAISTLHGFAQRILAENPLEAGLPPLVEVHSEIGAQVEFERRWRRFLDDLLDDPTQAEVVQRAVVAGISTGHLKTVARLLEDHWDRLPADPPTRPPLGPVDLSLVVAPLREALVRRDECHEPDDKMHQVLTGRGSWLRTAAEAQDAVQRLEALTLLVDLDSGRMGRTGAKRNWPAGALDEVRDLVQAASESAQAELARVVDDVLRRLVDRLGRFTLDGVDQRRAAGRLQFHDLLVMTRDLLRRSPGVRRRLHDTYRHLLIDEFQDTDPIQIEIARLIAASREDLGDADWSEITSDPGRLFFVGDAKQSIYRFRRADIRLFLGVRDSADTEPRVLSTNFRTVPGIVEWVNRAFAEIIGDGVDGAQPAYNPLAPHRSADEATPVPVVALGGLTEGSASERRTAMSDDLAAALLAARRDGWRVRDGERSDWRPPQWSDMAVLVPTRTGLPELRAAFDRAEVPYRIEASSLVWLTQEVRDVLSVLRAIDDPTDALSLVAALRSPGFGCGDDDLARFVTGGGRLELDTRLPDDPADDDPVAAGIRALQALHRDAVWDEPSALVERVIRQQHLMELATATRRPRDVWRRLRFVADQARAYADAEGGTLRDFLDWTALQADETVRVSETILPETDDDAVRVLTIHASKGLEFPIVAVAGLDRDPEEVRYGVNVLWDEDRRPEIHLRKGLSTSGHPTRWEEETAHEGYESWRLVYVATTRARDHLVLCLHHGAPRGSADNIARRLHELGRRHPDTWRPLADTTTIDPTSGSAEADDPGRSSARPDAAAPPTDETPSAGSPDPVAPRQARAAWIAARAARLDEAARPTVVAATAVAALAPIDPLDQDQDPAGAGVAADDDTEVGSESEPWRRGRAGTSIGRAVHAVLQTVDLATGEGLASVADAQAAAEGIPGRAREVERLARAALGAPAVAAAATHRHWRELYVGAAVEGVLCEGYLDLLVEGPDGLEIVDYKTDRTPDPHHLVDRYRLQTATYALMVAATLDRPIHRCVLVVVGPGGATEVEVPDLSDAMDEVRHLLRTHGRPVVPS